MGPMGGTQKKEAQPFPAGLQGAISALDQKSTVTEVLKVRGWPWTR